MEAQPEHPAGEIKRLRRCINDLISVLALPAMWSGGEPSQIARTLLDVLLDMLRLDLVYVRLEDRAGEAPVEMVRAAQPQRLTVGPREMGELLNRNLGDDPKKWPPFFRNRIGETDLSLVPLRMGLQGELGVIVAGSQRPDFPGQTETLLLSVAANQATIGLQGARLLSKQKRITNELDQQVARRTSELAAANEELQLRAGLLQHIPVAAWTLRPDGTPDFVNRNWLEYAGQTLDYIRSNPEAWMTAIHPDDRESVSTSFWDGISSGRGFTIEARFRRALDGVYHWHPDPSGSGIQPG